MATTMTAPHKRSVAEEPVTSILPGGDVPFDPTHDFNPDEEVLAALGYKSEFKREFSLYTTFCVSFAVLGLLPSFASTLFYGMGYAGTAGMCSLSLVPSRPCWLRGDRSHHLYSFHLFLLSMATSFGLCSFCFVLGADGSFLLLLGMTWGWIVAMIGIQSVACSMAELCSSMPTSGGLYYASAVLAPPGWGPFAAWITGWSNWLAQITAAPSGEYKTSFFFSAFSNP